MDPIGMSPICEFPIRSFVWERCEFAASPAFQDLCGTSNFGRSSLAFASGKFFRRFLGWLIGNFGWEGGCWWWVGFRDWLIWFFVCGMILNLIASVKVEEEANGSRIHCGGSRWLYFGSEALNRIELPHKVLWTKTMTGSLLESPVYKKYWLIDGSSSMWKACIFSIFRARFVQDAWNKHVDTWVTLMLPKKPWGVSSFKFGSAGVQKTNSCFMKLAI